MAVRSPAVAGRFYPSDPAELDREVGACLAADPGPGKDALALVVPHAGYRYSGRIAGAAFARVAPPKRAVVLGPNHTGLGSPRSLFALGRWELPGGGLSIDEELCERLRLEAALEPDTGAHQSEHSIEVELPFLRALRRDVKFAPICLARLSLQECRSLGEGLARVLSAGDRALLVASTDFSHYLPAPVARELDARAIDRIAALDAEGLYRVVTEHRISMCGFVPTTVVLFAARALGACRADLVRYGHSGEASGDYERVVGYASFVLA